MKPLRLLIIALYLALSMLPLGWMVLTSFKTRPDAVSAQAKFIPSSTASAAPYFKPSLEGYTRLDGRSEGSKARVDPSKNFWQFLLNSVTIAGVSTAASVVLGTSCAYGFSRFRIAGSKDWLFFILSTRFLPPLAVVMPIYLMWSRANLQGTALGLIILYTAFNLSLAVWLMKGFIDEIPKAFEEAALVDGYSRLDAFFRIVVPQARTGMAVTAVFCLISAWNEYGFAMTLNALQTKTVPVYFAGLQGQSQGIPWPQIAAGAIVFVAPIILFTVLVRKHLLRGVTFGTVKA
ncbi:MAG: carbohydrate ABC transporter permease [Tepidisphaeraceae bacterium]